MKLRLLRGAGGLAAAAAAAAALCLTAGVPAASASPVLLSTITVGSYPCGVSSDGTHVWVTNLADGTVTELDAATGAVISTITVGDQPYGVSSDGTHVWVTNDAVGTVTELDAATGAVISTITVGRGPYGVSSDGTHVWVTNYLDNTVTELDAATGAVVSTITVGHVPAGVSSDGTHVWVTNAGDGTVTELDAATGAVISSTTTVGKNPYGVSSDGTHVWVTNSGDNTVTELGALVPQAISFTGPGTGTVGGQATLTATGGASGNPVIFTVDGSSTAGACAVSGTDGATVTYTGTGTCVIDANQAAGNGYAAAPQVQQSITVSPGAQAISFTGPGTGTVGGQATLTATGGPSGNPVTFTVDPSSTAGACAVSGTDGATVTYTGTGTCVIDANQAAGNGYAAAPQVQQSITVSPGAQAPSFIADSPPLETAPGQPYGYTFAATGTPAPTYALAPGAPAWLTISPATGQLTGTPPAGTTTFTYTVTATSTAGTATAGPYTVTVTPAAADAHLSVHLACPAALTTGTDGTCTLTVANAGPATARRITAAILLTPQLQEVSCTGGCTPHPHAVTWTLATLDPGASARLAITITATRPGRALLRGLAESPTPDPRPRNNFTVQTITITRPHPRRPRP